MEVLNDCYVIGTSLLYLKRVSFERLEKIKENLSTMGISVDLSEESIKKTVDEWRDFFVFIEDGLALTERVKNNLILVEVVFNAGLSSQVRECLKSAIYHYNKPKVIQFPKVKSK